MRAVLRPPPSSGTSVLEKGANSTVSGDQVRIEDAILPEIDSGELPLPLDDVRRSYRSNIHGIRLTHPGGPVEGGSSSEPPSGAQNCIGRVPLEIRQYAQRLIQDNTLKTPSALRKFIATETQRSLEELRTQMHDRKEAIDGNERIVKEISAKEGDRAYERKLLEKKLRELDTRSRRES